MMDIILKKIDGLMFYIMANATGCLQVRETLPK